MKRTGPAWLKYRHYSKGDICHLIHFVFMGEVYYLKCRMNGTRNARKWTPILPGRIKVKLFREQIKNPETVAW